MESVKVTVSPNGGLICCKYHAILHGRQLAKYDFSLLVRNDFQYSVSFKVIDSGISAEIEWGWKSGAKSFRLRNWPEGKDTKPKAQEHH